MIKIMANIVNKVKSKKKVIAIKLALKSNKAIKAIKAKKMRKQN